MLSSTKKHTPQLNLFTGLGDTLDQKHPLYILSHKINWIIFEEAFKKHYSEKMGKPSKPIRLMVSLLILKYVRNLSDEALVEHWSENVYYQYFSGEQYFQPTIPCVPTELVAFRQRIGTEGTELILKESIRVNDPGREDKDKKGNEEPKSILSLDTTVQEKNITYPTDDKLAKKIIKKCWKIADKEHVKLRQSYVRTVKKVSQQQRFKNTKEGAATARKANKKIKVIAGRLLRDLERKIPAETQKSYMDHFRIFHKILMQKRGDTDKIYSLHEPDVKCYSKGKEHKKFEFGSKASILVEQTTGILVGAINFTETLHDSKTVPKALDQYERLTGKTAKEVYVDRGYRGISEYKMTQINVPKPDKNITKTKKQKHSRRAAIEPVIGHLKNEYRLCRNFLKGIIGDNMNVILSAAAMNFKRVMNLWRTEEISSWQLSYIFNMLVMGFLFPKKLKMTF